MVLRIKMKKDLNDVKFKLTNAVEIDLNRLPEIAGLLLEAYRNTPDYEEDSLEETIEELNRLKNGSYGKFLYDHSYMITDEDNKIISVIFLTDFKDEATVTYLFTDPHHKGKGYATDLLETSFHSLFTDGKKEIFLYVTNSNIPAISLYKSLGFYEVPITAAKKEIYLDETIERELP